MKTLLLLFFSCLCASLKAEEISETWVNFKNPTNDYSFYYPASWKLKEVSGEYTIYKEIDNSQSIEAEINFLMIPHGNDSSFENSKKVADKLLKVLKSRPNFQLIDSRNLNRSGNYGWIIDFTATTKQKETERSHTIIWQIIKGTNIYRLMYQGKTSLDTKYIKTIYDIFDSYSFLKQSPRFNRLLMSGNWSGTISEGFSTSLDNKPVQFNLMFTKYNDSTHNAEMVQFVKNVKGNKTDTFYYQAQTSVIDEGMKIIYNHVGLDKQNCFVELYLTYDLKDGNHYLTGNNSNSSAGCYHISLSIKKGSDEIGKYAYEDKGDKSSSRLNFPPVTNKTFTESESKPEVVQSGSFQSDSDLALARTQLFKTITKLSIKVLKGEVLSMGLSDDEKNSILKKSGLQISKDGIHFTQKGSTESFEAELNAFDFNGDGKYEIVLWKHDGSGPQGASEFTIFYNTNRAPTWFRPVLTEYGFPEATREQSEGFSNIRVVGPGMVRPLYKWRSETYRSAGMVGEEKPIVDLKLVGGSNPEELGKNLLKALQTNNLQLWVDCLHPIQTKYRSLCEFRFQQNRDRLEGDGISNWNQIKFSRVTYSKEGFGGDDGGIVKGEQVRRNFIIEFTYDNGNYLGRIGAMTIETYKHGKYFLFFQSEGAGLRRLKKN